MDTRTKILTPQEAVHVADRLSRQGEPLTVAAGCFDPVLAAHARKLEELRSGGGSLMVVVTDPPRPILPARARAELVAALAVVDHVVTAGDAAVEGFLANLRAAAVVRWEADDGRIAEDLISHVHTRQRAS